MKNEKNNKSKKNIIFVVCAILMFLIGVSIGSVYAGRTNNIVYDCNNQNESSDNQESNEKQDYNDLIENISTANDIQRIIELLNTSYGDYNFLFSELYSKDKVILKDIDKRILISFAFHEVISNPYLNDVELPNRSGKMSEIYFKSDELRNKILNDYSLYFNNKSFVHSDINKLFSDREFVCPYIEYNSKTNEYLFSGNCGLDGDIHFKIYKYTFSNENNIAYVNLSNIDYKDGSKEINQNYKFTFKPGIKLYSIEKIKD